MILPAGDRRPAKRSIRAAKKKKIIVLSTILFSDNGDSIQKLQVQYQTA
jgi:hypothetical protein